MTLFQLDAKLKISEILKELVYPVTETTVLLANVMFALLATLVTAALRMGPSGLLILPIAVIGLPAYFRFALYVLEARAHGQKPSPPGIETFSWAESFWSLFPLVFLSFVVWLEFYLASSFSRSIVILSLAFFIFIYPASMAVLAVTRSPLGSINPVNIYNMIRLCGIDYVTIAVSVIVATLGVNYLIGERLGLVVNYFFGNYVFFLMFSVTGAVLHRKKIVDNVDIEDPVEPGEDAIAADLLKERQNIANHAYGFASRGNRDGALRHIRRWIENEAETSVACEWFFQEMLNWEPADTALFFAQDYFAHLLSEEREAEALKLISRCLYSNPRWKPLQRDRDFARELARKHKRQDLLDRLNG